MISFDQTCKSSKHLLDMNRTCTCTFEEIVVFYHQVASLESQEDEGTHFLRPISKVPEAEQHLNINAENNIIHSREKEKNIR